MATPHRVRRYYRVRRRWRTREKRALAAAIGLTVVACLIIGGLLLYLNPPKAEKPGKLPPVLQQLQKQ